MTVFDFKKGLLKLGEGVWAYILPEGSWGLNNAGLVTENYKFLFDCNDIYDINIISTKLKVP